ncbi:hypothetical protein O0L34_g11393 [Tuta absoluta]|nr:hypothetical protein O0L34_g11393 [Tuta absoluta]
MQFYLFLCIVAGALARPDAWSLDEEWIGWHQKVGVKEAARIQIEEEIVRSNDRIVGGTIAPVYAHPYLAGILIDVIGIPTPSACGGSLLSSTRVLTAAHCWYDGRFQAWSMTIVLGSAYLFHGGFRVRPAHIAIHPQYEARTLANDIAMLMLPVHVPFSHAIQPISLPFEVVDEDITGWWTRASGYGRYSDLTPPTTNTMVRNIRLQTISLADCRAVYGPLVKDSNICTYGGGGRGICQGDSGGPLVTSAGGREVLIGVSSFVAYDGCELGHPSVFARVTSFRDWILQWM